MAAETSSARPKARRSAALIVWAMLFLLAGIALAALAITVWTQQQPTPSWTGLALAAGFATAVAGGFFLALGLFVVKLGPRVSPLTNDQRLIVRAATAMVLADRDAAHVEIEALRVWIERNFGASLAFDELRQMADANAGNRDAVITAVADHHRSHPSWGADDDQALIGACASVIVADLRNRDEEIDYLRRLAEAVEYDSAKRDALINTLKALQLELEGLVVAAIMARTNDEQR
jgi:hypothetical protein